MTECKVLLKYKKENEIHQVVISKIIDYYVIIKNQLLFLQQKPPFYSFSLIDNHILRYDKKDLKRIGDPSNFYQFVYKESIMRAIYFFIKNQLEKNNLKKSLKKKKYRREELIALNKTMEQFVNNGIFKTNEEIKNIAYEHYNNNYTNKKDINKNSLEDDIMVVNIYLLYFYINNQWNANDINELSDNLPNDGFTYQI